ncbi:MAG: SH3 domain-containing protein [Desulfuromonadales bacterium]|nr:SH3 domain-containing protein [Desulfuromonadales bacterium]
MLRVIVGLLLILTFVSGCSLRPKQTDIADLQRLPQSASYYLNPTDADKPLTLRPNQNERAQQFRQKFFAPWQIMTADGQPDDAPVGNIDTLFWAVEWLDKGELYGANLRRHPRPWIEALIAATDQDNYPSLNRRAITVRRANLRALPTATPCFRDPYRAGEGYPFDYLQNSVLEPGVPLRITHQTPDGSWLLVETALVSGWVTPFELAYVDETFAASWQGQPLMAFTREQVALTDDAGQFRGYAHIGTLLPLGGQPGALGDQTEVALWFAVADSQRRAVIKNVRIAHDAAALFPLAMTPRQIALLGDHLLGEVYGWGGIAGGRDCSATLRDLFTPFGLWLPRNSSKQIKLGAQTDLSGLSLLEKQALLAQQGIPFASLLGMKGHILLYLGQYQGEAVALHTLWGLKTADLLHGVGRKLVGGTVITSLQPGAELLNLSQPEGNLLYRIDHISSLLTLEKPGLAQK